MVDAKPEEGMVDASPVAKKIFSFMFFDARWKRDMNPRQFLEEENFEIGIQSISL